MAPINPWLARLVESELDNVIAWKSIVKPEPGAGDEGIAPRFSDDGSNLRSFVGSPPLDSESTIQLLEKPGSNARAKIPVSDGDVSVLAVLSDAAWEAYDTAIEEEGGDEPRKGDLLICKRITVISTAWGPSDEHVKLRIEDLELAGNIRKTIGNPTSLLQRDSIATLCKKIEKLRSASQQSDAIEENDANEEEEDDDDEEEEDGSEEEARSPSRSQKLPPDSSAEPSSTYASRLGTQAGVVQSSSRQQESPNQKVQPAVSQTSRNEGGRSVPYTPNTTSTGRRDGQQISAIRGAGQHAVGSASSSNSRQRDLPTDPIRSQATPVISKTAKQRGSQQSPPMPPTSGANARPVASQSQRRTFTAPAATQQIPTGPKNTVPLADNHRGPVLSSSQRSESRQRPTDQRVGSTPTPIGAPTGPKAHRSPQYNLPNRGSGLVRTFPRPSQSGDDFYRPSPSAYRRVSRVPAQDPASKQQTGGSQAPNGTSEMETAVPRSLPPSKHHQQRREYMRGAQREQWLEMRFSSDEQGSSSMSTSQLCRLYRIKYPNDPVSEHDFARLVDELRPHTKETERSSVPPENEEDIAESASLTSRALTEEPLNKAHSGSQVESIGHDSPPSPQPPLNGIFVEFANRWKNMRPDAALARDGPSHVKAPKRKLNVLGWGIG